MPVVGGEEGDEGAEAGFDDLVRAVFISGGCPEFELAAVAGLPVLVEVDDGGDDPVAGVPVAVEVGFVEGALGVDGEMPLEIEETEEEASVDGEPEFFEGSEVALLRGGALAGAEPHDVVAPNVLSDDEPVAATDARPAEPALIPGDTAFARKGERLGRIEKLGSDGPALEVDRVGDARSAVG